MRKRRTLCHAPHPKMTLKSAAPCVKATSHSSTARPQEKAFPHGEEARLRRLDPSGYLILRDAASRLLRTRGSARGASVPAMDLLHRRELLGAGRALMGRLPGLVGHAVDGLAALVLAHISALGVGFFLEPVGQAVAAEACKVHQVDVLDIAAGAQMLDQAPENGSFKFCSGFVVNRHDRHLAVLRRLLMLDGKLSHILPYRSANRGLPGSISAADGLKTTPRPLTAPAHAREIVNELI